MLWTSAVFGCCGTGPFEAAVFDQFLHFLGGEGKLGPFEATVFDPFCNFLGGEG